MLAAELCKSKLVLFSNNQNISDGQKVHPLLPDGHGQQSSVENKYLRAQSLDHFGLQLFTVPKVTEITYIRGNAWFVLQLSFSKSLSWFKKMEIISLTQSLGLSFLHSAHICASNGIPVAF